MVRTSQTKSNILLITTVNLANSRTDSGTYLATEIVSQLVSILIYLVIDRTARRSSLVYATIVGWEIVTFWNWC
jgi:hypothetical protein